MPFQSGSKELKEIFSKTANLVMLLFLKCISKVTVCAKLIYMVWHSIFCCKIITLGTDLNIVFVYEDG